MIHIKNLRKEYSGLPVLDNVNVRIDKNEFVYLVGPSGSGKSTLLEMIYLANRPTRGDVYINNVSLSQLRPSQIPFLRRKIGVVFQDFKLLPKRTVFENVSFALRFLDISRARIRRQVSQVLDLVGLIEKMHCYPEQLSGGEQQRICIARAIVNNPTVLLADEPTGSLDPDTSWEIVQLLSKINARQTTVIVATHNRGIVDDIRKRVIALENGVVVRDQQLGAYHPA